MQLRKVPSLALPWRRPFSRLPTVRNAIGVTMIRLTRRLRLRAAAVLAAAYALCVVAPPVALAFAGGAVAAHCLTDDHHLAASVHVHADGTPHAHVQGSVPHDHASQATAQYQANPQDADAKGGDAKGGGTCCGMFCVNAATEDTSVTVGIAPRASLLQAALAAPVHGHGPGRIDRPPITLASS